MDMVISRQESGDSLLLVVSGRLDAEHADDLARAVDEELRQGHHAIAIDLKDCGFLSSAGIRVLFGIHRAAQRVGGRCLIREASEPVRQVLELTKLAGLFMEHAAVGSPRKYPGPSTPSAEDLTSGGVRFIGLERPHAGVRGSLVGSADVVTCGPGQHGRRLALAGDAFAVGLAALAEDAPLAARAGEAVAACGTAFHRRPRPFSAVDYMVATGDLVPELDVANGLVWTGLPSGRAGFEMAGDEPIAVDELVAGLFEQTEADVLAVVVAGEVAGLVGAELIRPLAEATATDRLGSPDRSVAARWLSFSREPVHARRAAVIVGVATRATPTAQLAPFVRRLGHGLVHGHLHAVVFPPRPLSRGVGDLTGTVADLSASAPLALVHLLCDPQPVLGGGRSEMVRGRCWFAPLDLDGATA